MVWSIGASLLRVDLLEVRLRRIQDRRTCYQLQRVTQRGRGSLSDGLRGQLQQFRLIIKGVKQLWRALKTACVPPTIMKW